MIFAKLDILKNRFLSVKPQNKLAWSISVQKPTRKASSDINNANLMELCTDIEAFILQSKNRKEFLLFIFQLIKGSSIIYNRQIKALEADVEKLLDDMICSQNNLTSGSDISLSVTSDSEDNPPQKKRRTSISTEQVENVGEGGEGSANVTMREQPPILPELRSEGSFFDADDIPDDNLIAWEFSAMQIEAPATDKDPFEKPANLDEALVDHFGGISLIPEIAIAPTEAQATVQEVPEIVVEAPSVGGAEVPSSDEEEIETAESPVVAKERAVKRDVVDFTQEELAKMFTITRIHPRRWRSVPSSANQLQVSPEIDHLDRDKFEFFHRRPRQISERKTPSQVAQIGLERSEELRASQQQLTRSGTGLHVEELQGQDLPQVSTLIPDPTVGASIESNILAPPEKGLSFLQERHSEIASILSETKIDESTSLEEIPGIVLSKLRDNENIITFQELTALIGPDNKLNRLRVFNALLEIRQRQIIEIIKKPGSIKVAGVKRGRNWTAFS